MFDHAEFDDLVDAASAAAVDAFFKSLAVSFADAGCGPTFGDVAPWEAGAIEETARAWTLMFARNNATLAPLALASRRTSV